MYTKNFHYGWIICIGCMLLTTVTMGMVANTGFSVYMPLIEEAGNYSGVEISLIITIRSVFTMISMFLLPAYYKILNIRLGTALSAALAAVTFVIYGLADCIELYYVGAAVAGVSYGLGSMIPVSILINRWFLEKRAFAVGIAACGTGIATLIVPKTVAALSESLGLKPTMYLEAAVILVSAVLIFLLLRNDPKSVGCTPYGSSSVNGAPKTQKGGARDLSGGEWCIVCVAMAFAGAVSILVTSNISLLFTSQGQSSTSAASAISILGIVLIVAKILYGKITDSVGGYVSNYLFTGILLLGLILSCCIEQVGPIAMYLSTILMGLGLPIALVGLSVWAADFSTPSHYDIAVKRLQIAYQAGGLIFSAVPGFLADQTGNYVSSYILFCILLFVSTVAIQGVYLKLRK